MSKRMRIQASQNSRPKAVLWKGRYRFHFHCFIFLVSIKVVIILNILDSKINFLKKLILASHTELDFLSFSLAAGQQL
jgi:hypothetical protein